jgi:hypothetical protein
MAVTMLTQNRQTIDNRRYYYIATVVKPTIPLNFFFIKPV